MLRGSKPEQQQDRQQISKRTDLGVAGVGIVVVALRRPLARRRPSLLHNDNDVD